ncbi:MAG: PTS sugar transporter subunit IIA [Gemmatimonadales bacterium]
MLLTELLTPDQAVMPVVARDKGGVIAELTRVLADRCGCDYSTLLGAVQEREANGSTGIGFGVAIPHARAAGVPELSLVCGVSASPVPFDAIDGEPVRLFFLIVGPPASAGQHLQLLGRIARLVRHEDVRRRLFAAATPREFYNTLLDAEAR